MCRHMGMMDVRMKRAVCNKHMRARSHILLDPRPVKPCDGHGPSMGSSIINRAVMMFDIMDEFCQVEGARVSCHMQAYVYVCVCVRVRVYVHFKACHMPHMTCSDIGHIWKSHIGCLLPPVFWRAGRNCQVSRAHWGTPLAPL